MKNLISLVFGICLIQVGFTQEPKFAVVRPDGTTFICPSLDSAYNRSLNGDKIFTPAGTYSLSKIINKHLHIIGVGINEDSIYTTGITQIDGITLGINSSNSVLENFITNGLGTESFPNIETFTINNIILKNLEIKGGIASIKNYLSPNLQNFIIRNCIIGIGGIIPQYCSSGSIYVRMNNSIISNCIIKDRIIIEGSNNIIANNILFGTQPFGTCYSYTSQLSSSIIKNNVCGQTVFVTNSSIFNNMGLTNPSLGNISQGNYTGESMEDIFINVGPSSNGYYVFARSNNYKIKNTSKAKNSGTDGTDRGIYGGLFPWDDSGQYTTPVIYHKKVGPNSTSDGKLKVEYKVRAGN